VITKHQGFKYTIRARRDGRHLFAVLWADADSRREEPIWVKTAASKAAAERGVKQWIDDRQPKPRRATPQTRPGAAHERVSVNRVES